MIYPIVSSFAIKQKFNVLFSIQSRFNLAVIQLGALPFIYANERCTKLVSLSPAWILQFSARNIIVWYIKLIKKRFKNQTIRAKNKYLQRSN